MKLADGYKNRRLMLVGDGSSQIWVKIFTNILSNEVYSTLNEEYENTVIIQKVLKQVIAFFYKGSHLRERQSCALIFPANLPYFFI